MLDIFNKVAIISEKVMAKFTTFDTEKNDTFNKFCVQNTPINCFFQFYKFTLNLLSKLIILSLNMEFFIFYHKFRK